MIRKLWDLIFKDVKQSNESKKFIVVLRLLLLSFIIYMLGYMLITDSRGIPLTIFMLVLNAGVFFASYHWHRLVVFFLFFGSILIWVYHNVHFYGWKLGFQNYLLLLLILIFFSCYGKYTQKMIASIVLCAFSILLYFYTSQRGYGVVLNGRRELIVQIANNVMIFYGIALVAYLLSRDSQALESKLVEYNARLQEQANTDTLTGLYNRRKAMDYLSTLVKKQAGDQIFSLCICDIDLFKKVNDNYGHDFGDEVLCNIGKRFTQRAKEKIFTARWGGEEFLIVFPNCNGDDAYVKLVEIQNEIRNMVVSKDGQFLQVTLTFGLTEYDPSESLDISLKTADNKLYIGKEKGRDVIIY